MERQHLIAHNKLDYVRGKRPDVACILCAVRDQSSEVDQLEVYRTEHFFVSLNLYPYNPGHLMIVPLRHIESPVEMTESEALGMHHLQTLTLQMIANLYPAQGFNLGYNLGRAGGGSIPHLHLHLVPRFPNEQGFMTTVGQTHILVEPLEEVRKKFIDAFTAHSQCSTNTPPQK